MADQYKYVIETPFDEREVFHTHYFTYEEFANLVKEAILAVKEENKSWRQGHSQFTGMVESWLTKNKAFSTQEYIRPTQTVEWRWNPDKAVPMIRPGR